MALHFAAINTFKAFLSSLALPMKNFQARNQAGQTDDCDVAPAPWDLDGPMRSLLKRIPRRGRSEDTADLTPPGKSYSASVPSRHGGHSGCVTTVHRDSASGSWGSWGCLGAGRSQPCSPSPTSKSTSYTRLPRDWRRGRGYCSVKLGAGSMKGF